MTSEFEAFIAEENKGKDVSYMCNACNKYVDKVTLEGFCEMCHEKQQINFKKI